ncbi:hypothetical protein [Lacrimispora sphenoides]|uniref:hypothetical protein n=1 Tax=Lacrimispora sphenoides TaxID=29370 RepID=UPI000AF08D54|nr:hypothetical protein [Lacrimispora sphenoides]
MAKVDRAIAFIESNRCMMESLISQEDDPDIVSYVLNILKQHKKETPGAATPRESK